MAVRVLIAAASVLLVTLETAWANGSVEAAAFLRIADAVMPCPLANPDRLPTSSLPQSVSDRLWRDYYRPSGSERLPDDIEAFALDLNQDGIREYFLETPLGGSGGPHYLLVSRFENGWEEILSFQGWFCLLPPAKDWQPIVALSKGGWEIYQKTLFRFSDRRYQQLWAALFDHGKVTQTSGDGPLAPDRD